MTLKKLSACSIQGRKPIIVSEGASAVVSDIKEAAFRVAKEQFLAGMAYEPSSGLYYDYKVVNQILLLYITSKTKFYKLPAARNKPKEFKKKI